MENKEEVMEMTKGELIQFVNSKKEEEEFILNIEFLGENYSNE